MEDTLAFLFCVCMLLFMGGCVEALKNDKCEYHRIVSYTPTYWVACELFEKRW